MVKKEKSKKKKVVKRDSNFIDGWGLILLIIGIALFLLRPEVKFIGGLIVLIGLIRVFYILFKYG